jgi:hypothetical protein
MPATYELSRECGGVDALEKSKTERFVDGIKSTDDAFGQLAVD